MRARDRQQLLAKVRMLLQLGADVNLPSSTGGTALEFFVFDIGIGSPEHKHVLLPDDVSILKELLDAGAKADDILGTAAMNRYYTVVQEILQHGVDPNFTRMW